VAALFRRMTLPTGIIAAAMMLSATMAVAQSGYFPFH
jgi:hypothetical protein